MFDYGHGMNGWGYGLMGITMLTFLVLLMGAVVVLLLTHNRSSRGRRGDLATLPTADQLLAERFARGEIDHEEYAARQAALRAHVR